MRLAFDCREAGSSRRTGKGQWVYGLLRELLARRIPVTLITKDPLPPELRAPCVTEVRVGGSGIVWHLRVLLWLRRTPNTLYCSFTSFIVPALAPRSMKTAIMVHDLIAFLPDAHDRRARRIERMTLPLALKKAAHVFALSDSTKHDLLARFSDIIARDVPVLWAGPSRDSPLPRSDDGKSIVCIATLCPRKNQLRLIQAYAALPERLRSQHSLVLAGGRGWDDKDILRAVESTPGVQWLSYVSQEQYARLIADCHLFAWPTLYEGFGIPVLDAFQAGAPVLTSNAPGVRDVAADAALLVDPLSAPSITAGMERLLTDDALRAELAERGKRRAQEFSWQKTTELFLGALPPVLP